MKVGGQARVHVWRYPIMSKMECFCDVGLEVICALARPPTSLQLLTGLPSPMKSKSKIQAVKAIIKVIQMISMECKHANATDHGMRLRMLGPRA